ncbi:alpha/beta hydrolase [Planctomycetota bacterium]
MPQPDANISTSSKTVAQGRLHYRPRLIDGTCETLLFVHGLGESGASFSEAFQAAELKDINILIPDLLGFGESSTASNNDYSFAGHIASLLDLLAALDISTVHFVGHSMGGDIGTLFCSQYPERARSFVNIEGNLTPQDRFITKRALEAENQGRFDQWFPQDLIQGMVTDWARTWPSCARYARALRQCHPTAFLQGAHEILQHCQQPKDRDLGRIYGDLAIPRIYVWGSESVSPTTQAFLDEHQLTHRGFEPSFHWVMIDRQDLFYPFLAEFLATQGAIS